MTQTTKKKSATKKTPAKKNNRIGKKKTSKRKNLWWKTLIKRLFLLGLLCSVMLIVYLGYCYITMPNIQKAVSRTREPSTLIMAQNGNDIAKFGHVYAKVITPDNLPQNLTSAIISTEDHRFYQHFGIDLWGVSRALATNIFHKRYAQGASTITQQVAKNIFLTPNKNVKRKVQELLLAFWLEQKLSKNQIMALYLNRVYFGSGLYGAEAAANWYFNKSVYDLNMHEAAILAGLLKAPNRYNPLWQREKALARAKIVLQGMKNHGLISENQYQTALKQPIGDGQKYRVTGGKHFAQYVYDKVNEMLGERNEDIVVSTTLDQNLQETAERTLQQKIAAAQGQNVSEGAVVILDKSGAIKAMVGGVNYNQSQFNRAVQAKRQAGSAFKPFVYLTALQYGFTPNSVVHDSPIRIGQWQPENYNKKYAGDVSLTYALSKSLNAATVTLSKELYLKDIAQNAEKMGITTHINTTPSMVLGTNNVRVIDMAAAYASIANGGYAIEPYAINEIATRDGRQLYVRQSSQPTRILEPNIVRNISIMLENVINQGTGQRAKLPIFAAGKTGTTQNYRDAWFIGWTNQYIAAVWVGNDNEKPMKNISGGNLPAEIWHDIMLTTVKNTPHGKSYDDLSANSTDAIGDLIESTNADDDDAIGALIEATE